MNEIISAVVLGVVEGLTEYVPVSSTGHLILAGNALDFTGPKAQTFEIFIQLGAILAVVVLYFPRFLGLLNLKDNRGFGGTAGLGKLAIGCLPAFILGAALHDFIKDQLFSSKTVASALIVGALAMLWVERTKPKTDTEELDGLTYKQALMIGFFQCFALWPGMSRSASTIVGGMIAGLDRKTAAEFSFLLAVPVMVAAVGYDLLKSASMLQTSDVSPFATGFLISFITAVLAIRFFLGILKHHTLVPFAYYRLLLGAAVLWWAL